MTHSRTVCVHGKLITQCRCAAPTKPTFIGACKGDHSDLPVVYGGSIGHQVSKVYEPTVSVDEREALIALIKRIIPIQHEPMATLVANDWASVFIKEGWHR